jgi:hypothetical protein
MDTAPSTSDPPRQAELFRLRKLTCRRAIEAICELRPVRGQWECRLLISNAPVETRLCSSREAAAVHADRLRDALVERGWG